MPEEIKKEPWHFSRSFNLGTIVALVVQTATIVWFLSDMNSRVNANITKNERQDSRIGAVEFIVQNQAVTLGRMDENIKAILVALERLENARR